MSQREFHIVRAPDRGTREADALFALVAGEGPTIPSLDGAPELEEWTLGELFEKVLSGVMVIHEGKPLKIFGDELGTDDGSETGGYRSASCLDKPIRRIARAAGISKHLSPKFMRRTFQDLGRAAEVHDFVVRAISGHATVEMQSHYSTVGGEEVRAGLAKVISLAGFRAALTGESAAASGDEAGDEGGDSGSGDAERGDSESAHAGSGDRSGESAEAGQRRVRGVIGEAK